MPAKHTLHAGASISMLTVPGGHETQGSNKSSDLNWPGKHLSGTNGFLTGSTGSCALKRRGATTTGSDLDP